MIPSHDQVGVWKRSDEKHPIEGYRGKKRTTEGGALRVSLPPVAIVLGIVLV